MAPKKRKISSLIESQLPGFITTEYENFSKFVEKYYEQQESIGQPIDIISNLEKYTDIDYYEESVLKQSSKLFGNISADASTIILDDATSFPDDNGYIKIDDEILFYQNKNGNTLEEVSRGVSGNTTLGDLYHSSRFVTTTAAAHGDGAVVHNVSNLFLYALVKEFEKTYLSSFPEAYLKEGVDKRLLIKNITKFYKSKGTDRSIKFLFNSIISKSTDDVPEVIDPKQYTLKSSTSDWTQDYTVTCKILSGDPKNLIGQVITQDTASNFASAVVDNVRSIGSDGVDTLYQLIIEPTTINGNFEISGRSVLTDNITNLFTTGDRITVKTTMGFPDSGQILIGDEVISYNGKTVNQFIIDQRIGPIRNHSVGDNVYLYNRITGSGVSLIVYGSVYGIDSNDPQPYANVGELVQISDSGFETLDPIIYDSFQYKTRWFVNETPNTNKATVRGVQQKSVSDVGAIYEDDQYYYICSSSFPTGNSLDNVLIDVDVEDQKNLKLIRKVPSTTTEVYKTTNRDVGIFLDGVPAVSYRDTDSVLFGPITNVTLTNRGTGYVSPPTVLINEQINKARSYLAGNTIDRIEILTNESFTEVPDIRITSGEGAIFKPIVTAGAITSLEVVNGGRHYSSPPTIRIVDNLGKGSFAEFEAVINSNGEVESATKINGGRFYTRGNVNVTVESVGTSAAAVVQIREWVKDRYNKYKNNLDINNGFVFESYRGRRGYGYGYLAAPNNLRSRCYNNPSSYVINKVQETLHSPIIGYAYDGNPIYGPYGFSDPYDLTSSVSRINSGYQLKGNRIGGPDTSKYPLGTFIDDYQWVPSINSGKTELDVNNGRFCVTPEYPEGTYAYFVTVSDTDQTPAFPYILGENYYSLPVDSNYNSDISQDEVPVNVRALRTKLSQKNGSGFSGTISDIKSGNITSSYIESSLRYFSPEKQVYIDETGTNGSGGSIKIGSVGGRDVTSIESVQTKSSQIKILEQAYLFEGDFVRLLDENSEQIAAGELIGDVINSSDIVLRNVDTEFSTGEGYSITADTLVQNLILNRDASFTVGSTMILTNDEDEVIASGEILETTARKNSVKIKVTSNLNFIATTEYYLRSSNLSDTNRAEVVSTASLSSGLTPFSVNNNIAIVETADAHNLGVGDSVDVEVLPSDADTTTTYFVRKRLYQRGYTQSPTHSSVIDDSGIGSGDVLNSGDSYSIGTYQDVELIFQDQNLRRNNIGAAGDPYNAKATIVVSSFAGLDTGSVSSVIVTTKGKDYRKGDILTVSDEDLNRQPDGGTQRFVLEVDHVGFAKENTILYLTNVSNISQQDYLQIGNEILQVTSVDVPEKEVTVTRGAQGTSPTNHYSGAEVSLKDGFYRFDDNFRPFGEGLLKPYLIEYSSTSKELFVAFDYGVQNPQELSNTTSFFDSSIPAKQVRFRFVDESAFNLEFSTDAVDFDINPVIDIQKYYKYKFDVSHISMVNTYLDFSASANYNLFTEEKEVSTSAPGSPGSFVTIKLGFGPAIAGNDYQNKVPVNFQNYFYFIKAEDVDTSNSYLRIIDDPLTGPKRVTYTTNRRFVYSVDQLPAYDGSGSISYTTSSRSAIGNITSLKLTNTGRNYTSIPIVIGALNSFEAQVDVNWNSATNKIDSIEIIDSGSNYSKPIVVITDGDGSEAEFECTAENGLLTQVRVINKGKDYTYKPSIKIVESDIKIYLGSNNIGLPKTIRITSPGRGFTSDKTQISSYRSPTTFILRNIDGVFFSGEKLIQNSTGATATVAPNGYREGSNLLRVQNISGVFKNGDEIRSSIGSRSATLFAHLTTEFDLDIKNYIDNFGRFNSDRGKLSENTQKLTDSFFYQDYSYIIKSKTSIEFWRDLIKETIHPAGFKLFGEMVVDAKVDPGIPEETISLSHDSYIELPPVNISIIEDPEYPSKQRITTTILSLENLIIEQGRGSVAIDTFDSSETQTFAVELQPPFDGRFDPNTGQLIGTTSFSLLSNGTPLTLRKEEEIIVTLDGIYQEPGVSYVVEGGQIIFSKPPLGERIAEGQEVDAVKFYGRAIRFKNDDLSARYFKKLKNISPQFDGRLFEFDLYWEDGSIVKTDPQENLLVSLNGVIQKARANATEPFGNSYSIVRSEDNSTTDRIRFSKPPIDNDDAYESEEIPEVLKNYELCSIFTIGSYERLTIDSEIYEYRGQGPYLLLDEITRDVRKIDDPSYALVFIDGVLQREGDAYTIVGPNIEFTEPLDVFVDDTGRRVTQDVNVILMYGRDIPRTLTFYDFERSTFFNQIEITLSGTGVSENFKQLLFDLDLRSGSRWHFEQENGNVVGDWVGQEYNGPDEMVLTVFNERNVVIDPNSPLTVVTDFAYRDEYYINLPLTGTYTLSYEYKTDEDGDRTVRKKVSPWLNGYADSSKIWDSRNSLIANLVVGDRILIDGERDYREIRSSSMFAKVRSTNNGDLVQNNLYSKVDVSDYNGFTDGVGLSMTAEVDQFGQVSSLNVAALNWNQRDLRLYLEGGPLLQPTAYGYYEPPIIHFIPVDGKGGGARAEVIAYGGQIIDVVLLSGGTGYTQPPKVVVARKYKRIKENSRKIDSFTYLRAQPLLDVAIQEPKIVTEIVITGAGATSKFFSIVSFGSFTGAADPNTIDKRRITDHIWPDPDLIENPLDLEINLTSEDDTRIIYRPTLFQNVFSVNAKNQVTLFNGGLVSHVTEYNFCKQIEENVDRQITSFFSIETQDAVLELDTRSINGVGSYLDAPVDLDDEVLWVANTSSFPDTASRLRINGEVFYYGRKLEDRFINVIRGYQGSPVENHQAGDLVFHDQLYTTAISVGATIVESEIVLETKVTRQSTAIVNIKTEAKVEDIDTDINYEYQIEPEEFKPSPDRNIISIVVPQVKVITSNHVTQTSIRQSTASVDNIVNLDISSTARMSDVVYIRATEQLDILENTEVEQFISLIETEAPVAFTSSHILTLSHQEQRVRTEQQIVAKPHIKHVLWQSTEIVEPHMAYSSSTFARMKLADAFPEKHFQTEYVTQPFDMLADVDIEVNAGVLKALPSAVIITTKADLELIHEQQHDINAGDTMYSITQATLDVPDHEMLFSTSKIIGGLVYYKQPLVIRVEGSVDDRHDLSHNSTSVTASLDINITSSSKFFVDSQKTHTKQISRRIY